MEYEEELHLWILPSGTIINYQGIAYKLNNDTEVLGNTPIPEKFIYPEDDVLHKFFEDDGL